MTRARLLFAALVVSALAATTAPAQPPATDPTRTPSTPAAVDPDVPTADADEYVDLVVVKVAKPWMKLLVPVTALFAIAVIALFVTRWRKTGEIPGPTTGTPPPGI